MTVRIWSNAAALVAVMLATAALAQDKRPELTPAGKAILQDKLAIDGRPLYDRPGPGKPITFPLAMCTFPGGLCGAVRRDGSVAVLPRYDWVGTFSDNRAAVRLNGLYGFVDEDGREVVKPQYRIVDDYHFGFAQVDVGGKSSLIDRDGKMVIEPKYGFIRAIAPDRFAVSERRELGGMAGGEDFSGSRVAFPPGGGVSVSVSGNFLDGNVAYPGNIGNEVIDISGHRIEPSVARWSPPFDKDDPSIRWVQRDKLWGLARADGSWLVEPKFQQIGSLIDGLAQVTLNGKVGFIGRSGNFVIEPAFDKALPFKLGFGRTSAERDGFFGVIDTTGAWIFRTDYQQIQFAANIDRDYKSETVVGWNFKKADRWGLLDLDGRVVLDAGFDQPVGPCPDGRLEAYKNKERFYFKADGSPLQPPGGQLIDAMCRGGVPPYTLKIGDKFGLVDASSNLLTAVQFDAVTWAGPGVKNVKINGKWGRIGADGRWLLEPKFDYLSGVGDVFVASVDGKRGFMRSDGSWLVEPKFDAAARRRIDDTAFVTISGATGVLRLTDQSWVVPPRPGALCDISHALMSEAGGKRAILSRTGETWVDIGAERVGANLEFGLLTFLKDGKWGLVDTAGQVMIEPRFDEPVHFGPGQRGVAWTKRDGQWCAIDRRGSSVPGIACAAANPTGSDLRLQCKVEP
ncbi:WG repeat-containing protein [Bradyrhizobium sp. AUGA SZCCT0182]|uniref:WG repeat-containing protein n=1 Tax=Bradyrhizobium sp. AUGA SZCCT0182 TaxID=2807667 RepID=UPI001BA70BD1|nr:WG repeat-containing protein [Bradyrhizobium sp. AUGA SZCCT0182]MBR1237206.1 WG repeat-containing protein [Bradyrhizobium sp. AUGA SZCCT0182]